MSGKDDIFGNTDIDDEGSIYIVIATENVFDC